jgi:hypothetical protein
LAWEAFQRGDITEEICRERFRTRKARFVVYNKPHLYIGASVQINELHLKQAHYTTMLEDLMKLYAIWEGTIDRVLSPGLIIKSVHNIYLRQQRPFAWNSRKGNIKAYGKWEED